MKKLILISLLGTQFCFATIDSTEIETTVKSFDAKTVTMEVAGETHKFDREKLGKNFKNLAVGDKVKITFEKKQDAKTGTATTGTLEKK